MYGDDTFILPLCTKNTRVTVKPSGILSVTANQITKMEVPFAEVELTRVTQAYLIAIKRIKMKQKRAKFESENQYKITPKKNIDNCYLGT